MRLEPDLVNTTPVAPLEYLSASRQAGQTHTRGAPGGRSAALGDYSITQIAFRYGFNDAARFSRKFTERYGVSTKEYRHSMISPAP